MIVRCQRWEHLAIVLAALAANAAAHAGALITEHVALQCAPPAASILRCSYRPLDDMQPTAVSATWHNTIAPSSTLTAFPGSDETTAVLFLVDTSDPARQPAVARAVQHVHALLDSAPAHVRFGLASFDTDLYLLAPVGSSVSELHAAAATLAAKGKTTELYRNIRDATRLLEKVPATRRALIVLSDGLAEDFAYRHEDVIAAARASDVVIDSIGLPRSVAQSVALQSLRRLSDDTGGFFIQADHSDFAVPATSLAQLFKKLDAGGTFSIDLAPLTRAGAHDAIEIVLNFDAGAQKYAVTVPVELPAIGASPATPSLPIEPGPMPIAPIDTVAVAPTRPMWAWFGVLFALLLIILAIVVSVYRRVRRQERATLDGPKRTPLAYVVLGEAPNTRHIIDHTPWRIGRGRNADLVLVDHSVSRLHAEIRQAESGALLLHDLESLNGVFVNDTRVDTTQLREGDAIDIGDVRLNYTLRDENHATLEATVMVRTRMPE